LCPARRNFFGGTCFGFLKKVMITEIDQKTPICYGNVKLRLRVACVFKYFPVPSKPLFYWLDGLFLSLLCFCVLPCILTVLVFVLVLGILGNEYLPY